MKKYKRVFDHTKKKTLQFVLGKQKQTFFFTVVPNLRSSSGTFCLASFKTFTNSPARALKNTKQNTKKKKKIKAKRGKKKLLSFAWNS